MGIPLNNIKQIKKCILLELLQCRNCILLKLKLIIWHPVSSYLFLIFYGKCIIIRSISNSKWNYFTMAINSGDRKYKAIKRIIIIMKTKPLNTCIQSTNEKSRQHLVSNNQPTVLDFHIIQFAGVKLTLGIFVNSVRHFEIKSAAVALFVLQIFKEYI